MDQFQTRCHSTIFDFIIGLAVYFDSEVIIGSPVTEKTYEENTVDFVLRVKEKVEFYEESGRGVMILISVLEMERICRT